MSGPNSASLPGNGGVEEWLELESDPGVFSLLIEDYGVRGVKVEEVYDVSKKFDSEVFGFVFLFRYELTDRRARKKARDMIEIDSYVLDDGVMNKMFFAHQIITNSCATHALLSVLLNCQNLDIGPNLQRLKEFTKGLDPESKGFAIANMMELAHIHNKHARPLRTLAQPTGGRKSTIVSSAFALLPETYHYVSFVPINGRLFELDGLKEYPMDHGPWGEHEKWTDLFQRTVTQRFLESQDCLFNLMALIPDPVPQISECLKSLQDQQTLLLESAVNLAREVIAKREKENKKAVTSASTPTTQNEESAPVVGSIDEGSLPATESPSGEDKLIEDTSNKNEKSAADSHVGKQEHSADPEQLPKQPEVDTQESQQPTASPDQLQPATDPADSTEDFVASQSVDEPSGVENLSQTTEESSMSIEHSEQSADNVDQTDDSAMSVDPTQTESEDSTEVAAQSSREVHSDLPQSAGDQATCDLSKLCDDTQPTTNVNPMQSTADCEGESNRPQSPVKTDQLNTSPKQDQEQSTCTTSSTEQTHPEQATTKPEPAGEDETSICTKEDKCQNELASTNNCENITEHDNHASDNTDPDQATDKPKIKEEKTHDIDPKEEPMDLSEPSGNAPEAALLNEIARALPADSSKLDVIADTLLDGSLSLDNRLRVTVAKVVKIYKEADGFKQKLKEEIETKQRFRVEHSRRTHDYDTFIFDFVKCLAHNKQLPDRVLRRPAVAPPTRGHFVGRRKKKRGVSRKPRTTLLLNGSKIE